jgi:uncharacterized protein YoxC
MSTLVEVSIVIIAASIVLFIMVLIPVLIRVGSAAKEIARLVETARHHVAPITHDVAVIMTRAKDVSDSVSRQVVQIEGSIQKYKAYEAVIDEKIARPLVEFIALASGIVRGFNTFMRHLKRRT